MNSEAIHRRETNTEMRCIECDRKGVYPTENNACAYDVISKEILLTEEAKAITFTSACVQRRALARVQILTAAA